MIIYKDPFRSMAPVPPGTNTCLLLKRMMAVVFLIEKSRP